jgi:hypothetical protein
MGKTVLNRFRFKIRENGDYSKPDGAVTVKSPFDRLRVTCIADTSKSLL